MHVYGALHSEDFDKANVLTDFFCKQTMLNNETASLPELSLFDSVVLSNIVVTSDDVKSVESVLKALPIAKLQVQMGSTIVFSENWPMISHLLSVHYSINS